MIRRFIRNALAGLGLLLGPCCALTGAAGPTLGLQTWTCRKMPFEDMVAFASDHGLSRIALYRAHVDPAAPRNINASKLKVMRAAGIEPYTMYSAMGRNETEDRQVFALAKQFGLKFLVVEPKNQAKWPELLAAAKQHGVKLAVHNHWLETPYGDPATVHALLEKYPDLHVCLDLGWVTAAGFDAAEIFRSYGDRVIDLHFKDKSVAVDADGKHSWVDTMPGQGDVNFDGVFKAIRETGWSGTMAIESDSDEFAKDPRELVQRSKNFFDAKWNASGMPLSFDYTRDGGELPEQWPTGIGPEDRAAIQAAWDGLQADLDALRSTRPATVAAEDDPIADVEIFARQARWSLRYQAALNPTEIRLLKSALHEGRRRAALLRQGQAPWREATGRILRGHRSGIDGSAQPYGVVVPEDYDGSRPLRLDVVLHGSIRSTGGTAMQRFANWFQRYGMGWRDPEADYLEVYPLGRVTNGYRFAGETDIFEVIDAVCRDYAVDRKRIMLRGFSMGASGTWHVGLKHPDRFAALGPYMGYVDTPFFAAGAGNPRLIRVGELPAHEARVLPTMDAVSYVANAGLLPVVAAMGEKDPGVRNHQFMGRAFAAENMQLINLVSPGTGHRVALPTHRMQLALMDQLSGPGVDRLRPDVRFTTHSLRYGSAFGVHLLGLAQHDQPAEIDLQTTATDEVKIRRIRNVTAFALVADRLTGDHPRIVVQGRTVELDPLLRHERWGWVLARQGRGWRQTAQAPWEGGDGWRKRPGLQGPIDDAFTSAFLCVRGTGEAWHPAVQAAADERLRRFAYHWNRYWVGDLPIKDDRDVTEEDIRTKNLILWGDPGSNSVLARILPSLPLGWTREALIMNGQRRAAETHLPAMIHPNPLPGGEERYVVINSGHTFGEAAASSVAYLNYPRWGDWAVLPLESDKPVVAGHFDETWRF